MFLERKNKVSMLTTRPLIEQVGFEMSTNTMPHGAWPLLLSREQAGEYLNISASTFDKHVRPRLSEKQIGGRVLWDRREIEELFDNDPIANDSANREITKKAALARL